MHTFRKLTGHTHKGYLLVNLDKVYESEQMYYNKLYTWHTK